MISFTDKQFASQVFNSMNSGVIATDKEGKLLLVNAKAINILKLTPSQILGKTLTELGVSTQDNRPFLVEDCLQTGRPISRTDWQVVYLGKTMWLSSNVSPIRDEQGEVIGAVSVFEDVSEIKMLQEKLKHTGKLAVLGEVAAEMAHEIRNPISTISAALDVLDDRPGALQPEGREFTQLIRRNLQDLEGILNNMLKFARADSNRSRAEVDILTVLDDVLVLVRPKAREFKVGINLFTKEKPATVLGREGEIKQVFFNVILNALEAMTDGGTLEIIVDRKGSMIVIAFSDTGPGIPREFLDNLGVGYISSKENGAGIGLVVVRRIITEHHGSVFIDSGDDGTTVTIGIPYYSGKNGVVR